MKLNKIKKFIITVAIIGIATLNQGVVLPGQNVAAMAETKTKISLSASQKSLAVGKGFTLRLKNSGKAVKWSTSKKAVAALKKMDKNTVTVVAKKKGIATITAEVGKKKYNCKVIVKKPSMTTNQKAMAAYKKILEKKSFSGVFGNGLADEFYMLDIDRDGVKEMMINKDKVRYIYTYNGNKAVEILSRGGWGGNTLTYYKKSKALLFDQEGSGVHEMTYYRLKNGKMMAVAHIGERFLVGEDHTIFSYEMNGKKASKAKVEEYCKKLSAGSAVEFDASSFGGHSIYKKNTASNRNKYCK